MTTSTQADVAPVPTPDYFPLCYHFFLDSYEFDKHNNNIIFNLGHPLNTKGHPMPKKPGRALQLCRSWPKFARQDAVYMYEKDGVDYKGIFDTKEPYIVPEGVGFVLNVAFDVGDGKTVAVAYHRYNVFAELFTASYQHSLLKNNFWLKRDDLRTIPFPF